MEGESTFNSTHNATGSQAIAQTGLQPKKKKAKPTNTCAEWLVLLIKELIGTQTLDELGIILDFKHKMITIDEI